jgi:hypothetical protein
MPDRHRIEQLITYIGFFFILIFLSAAGIPVVGYVAETGALFAVILFAYRRRSLLLMLSSVGSISMASLIYGANPLLIGLWAMVVLPGAIFGRLLAYGDSAVRAFVIAMITVSIISVFLFWGERDMIYQSLDLAHKWVQTGLISNAPQGETGKEFIDWAANILAVIKRIMPSLMALSGVAQLFIGSTVLFLFLKGTGEFVADFGSFIHWKMPFGLIYPAGLLILFRLIGTEPIKIVADNGLLFLGIFYAVFGLAVVEYTLRKVKISTFLRVLFYIGLLFMQLPGLIMLAALGVFDSYLDFRRVRAKLIG